ncbi:peptidase dimerization domain-containing protein [Massilia sp. DD77]
MRNRGGHSSKPRADNAIYALANALARLENTASRR